MKAATCLANPVISFSPSGIFGYTSEAEPRGTCWWTSAIRGELSANLKREVRTSLPVIVLMMVPSGFLT